MYYLEVGVFAYSFFFEAVNFEKEWHGMGIVTQYRDYTVRLCYSLALVPTFDSFLADLGRNHV